MRLLIILTLVALASCKEKPFELPEDQPIEHESVIMQEFIYGLENAPTLEAHASTVEKSNGTVVASWFGGTKEKNKDVDIGSYPFFRKGEIGVSIVLRCRDQYKIDICSFQILDFVKEKNIIIVERD